MRLTAHSTRFLFASVLTLVLLSGCSDFRRIQRSDDVMKKYNAALSYYEDEKYAKAAILFEEILPLLRGKEEGEKAQFHYAYSLFNQGLYIESTYYFEEFYNTYGRSPLAEEALFMHAYSLYLQSPRYNLDQTSSFEAIEALQNFINIFAYSEYRDRATEILDELQEKLARKAYDNAKLYFNLQRYKAALIAFDTFAQDFPDSEYNEELAFLKLKTAYLLAENSMEDIQRERYFEALDVYQEFIEAYPNSSWLKEAESVFSQAQAAIDRLNKNKKTDDTNS